MIKSDETLEEYFVRAYAPTRLRGASSETVRQFFIQFRHFARFLGHTPTLDDLDDITVGEFLAARACDSSAVTSNKARNHILAVWRHAARKRIVNEFPELPPMREPERIPTAWTVKQVNRLLAACKTFKPRPRLYCGVNPSDWWTALHWFWWCGGERKSAALALLWNWTDLEEGIIIVPAEVRKGKTKDAIYYLQSKAVDAFRKILLPRRKLIFPFSGNNNTFYNHYSRLLKAAGLPTDRRSKPQKMRRSFASHLEANGGNATEALGHSARQVTKKSYLDPRICGNQRHSDLLPDLE